MKSLDDLIAEYLRLRRFLGFNLQDAEWLLRQFATYQQSRGNKGISVEDAVAWAISPGGDASWHASRLGAVRQFAAWASTLDPSVQVIPRRLLPRSTVRAVPFIYTDEQVTVLMATALATSRAKVALTYQTLIGLLACTGLRVGEAIRANSDDLEGGVLRINKTKFGKSRLVPLHPSALQELTSYREAILSLHGKALDTPALLVSAAGKRLTKSAVDVMFARVRVQAGVLPHSSRCRPRLLDFRHTFATKTLMDAYREGRDPRQVLPVLATYLGHVEPANTYWYLEATPELLGEAATKIPQLSLSMGDDND